jgi:2-polyprenyl-3-methyl-5-hydroxy-6-metoxy-1,4-benzoquinol methylase
MRKQKLSVRGGASRYARDKAVAVPFLNDFLSYGWTQLEAGRNQEAMDIAIRAIRIAETEATRALFVAAASGWSYFPGAEQISDVLSRALLDAWGKRSDFYGLALGILRRDRHVNRLIECAASAWPDRLPIVALLEEPFFDALAANPLLQALLRSGKIYNDVPLERALTLVRAAFLKMAIDGRPKQHLTGFACALAEQCFSNEYVFEKTEAESEEAASLQKMLGASVRERSRPSAFAVAVLGCYLPFRHISGIEKHVFRAGHGPLATAVAQQVREGAAIERQKPAVRQLTAIAHRTSVDVRAQYEQNPYPRWPTMPKVTPGYDFADGLAARMPGVSFVSPPKDRVLDVLIAGCGTGLHPVLFAQTFSNVRLLAVDLSVSSLAYAKMRSEELGLGRIDYAQADLLEIERTGRTFDVISSSGVLHHLKEPEQGLRALASVLRPNGFMHIGLYSATARRSVTACRDWLSSRGFTSTEDGIRRARQAIIDNASHEPELAGVLDFGDFFSTSECRDLLFHVQEENFTLPRIESLLDENKLRFLGLLVSADTRARFLSAFSPAQERSLAAWAEFEARHPDTFRGMYEFWVQREY